MPVTQNYEFPLYDQEDSPDLTLTGREAAAVIAIDAALKHEEDARITGDAELNASLEKETTERKAADKVLTDNLAKEVAERKSADKVLTDNLAKEVAGRKDADTALGERIDTEKADREAITGDIVKQLTKETTDRKVADTALGRRIDNAETEISANSADITGIKGLTYGDEHNLFVENDNGEYSSPALIEIDEQIKGAATKAYVDANHPTVSTGAITSTDYTGLTVTPTTDDNRTQYDIALNAASNHARGGVTIGNGLNVNPEGIISVDTAALPGGITGDTTWSELES